MVLISPIDFFAGIPSLSDYPNYLLEIFFPDEITPTQLVCAGIDLYVKSVRWPFTRYEAQSSQTGTDCITRGTCREVDATVWLVPRCGQDQNLNDEKACISTAPCTPFCMAARSSGSGNNNLVFTSDSRWRDGYTLLQRDCTISTATPNTVQSRMGSSGSISYSSSTSSIFSYTHTPQECTRATRVTSIVNKPSRMNGNVLITGQPFVIAGDTIFTEQDIGGGAWSVQVERLGGDEMNVFSLSTINQALPAEPKSLVPMEESEFTDQTRLLIPYSFQTNRMVSTSSRNYVFYASNPDMEVFSAYFEYCSRSPNSDNLGRFGLLIKSSYGPIRIYRVSAYRRCGAYSCGPDLVKSQTIPGFVEDFSRNCKQTFTVRISAMEYLNEENIAVTLFVSNVTQYISSTGDWNGVYKTVWLNPSTMNVQDSIWQTQIPSTATSQLCPSIQRMPRMGTFLAEAVNSVLFGIKFVLFSIVYTPGMVKVWTSGNGLCPVVPGGTYYHLVLANCGNDLYSLDDFFDSLEDAASVFWYSLSAVGDIITPKNMDFASPIKDVLDGMSQYGEGTIDIWTQRASVQTLTNLPISSELTSLWGFIRGGGAPIQGLSHATLGFTAWSRYCYKCSMEIAMALVRDYLAGTELTFDFVWTRMWGLVYDLQEYYSDTVNSKSKLSCAGLRLMFGGSNPWADVIYYQCMSGSELAHDMIGFILTIFVDAPMIKCVCKDAAGVDPATYVTDVCAPRMPLSLRPKLYMIANQIRGMSTSSFSNLQCAKVVDMTKQMISSSFDGWFQNQLSSLDALGDSINYFMDITDSQSGKCLDFQHDPHVVVLVPWPVDYFQRCAKTSLCKSLCAAEWEQFQSVLSPPVPLQSMTIATESLFFPGQLDTSLMLNNVTASTEISPLGVCTSRPSTVPTDFSLALAEFADNQISVQVWCVPQMASASVYRVFTQGFTSPTLPGTLLSIKFGDNSGTWLVIMVQTGGEASQAIFVVDQSGLTPVPSIDSHIPYGNYFVRIGNLWYAPLYFLSTSHKKDYVQRSEERNYIDLHIVEKIYKKIAVIITIYNCTSSSGRLWQVSRQPATRDTFERLLVC